MGGQIVLEIFMDALGVAVEECGRVDVVLVTRKFDVNIGGIITCRVAGWFACMVNTHPVI